MKIDRDKVLGSASAGDNKDARQFWPGKADDDDLDYEAFFRSFMDKLFAGRGSFKVGGSLVFEMVPKVQAKYEKLISTETAFYFHQMEEKGQFHNETYENDNYQDSAINNYRYQQKAIRAVNNMEEFMPVI